jgi:lipoprotein-anchoring transpeptidase ErfK/SrfK
LGEPFGIEDQRNSKHFRAGITLIKLSRLPSRHRWDLMVLVIWQTMIHKLQPQRGELCMIKFRRLIWTMIATAGLMLSASQSFAQQPDAGDQPGLIPDDSMQLDPEYQKQMVLYRTTEAPGTIIISTAERHLYLIQGNGRALRYGIGVGRDGFQWQGLLSITRKAEWPDWTPPPEMIARQPYLPRFMAGGPGNPLGARAMYLGSTVYRIHGTNQPDTIGTAISSGCFRLVNADVADLYDRVPVGTKVIVRQKPEL